MNLFQNIKERHRIARERDVRSQAIARIRVSDFDGVLYIAYDGTPLIPIESDWKTKEIMDQLNIVRNNYINSRLK